MEPCPACGGSGGGPFGPPGSAWDREDYACKRCHGTGVISESIDSDGPSVVKGAEAPAAPSKRTGTSEK